MKNYFKTIYILKLESLLKEMERENQEFLPPSLALCGRRNR